MSFLWPGIVYRALSHPYLFVSMLAVCLDESETSVVVSDVVCVACCVVDVAEGQDRRLGEVVL